MKRRCSCLPVHHCATDKKDGNEGLAFLICSFPHIAVKKQRRFLVRGNLDFCWRLALETGKRDQGGRIARRPEPSVIYETTRFALLTSLMSKGSFVRWGFHSKTG